MTPEELRELDAKVAVEVMDDREALNGPVSDERHEKDPTPIDTTQAR